MEPETNTQPIPPTTQQTPTQIQVPKNHNSSIILWLLILALVGVASYFGYQNWQLKQMVSQIRPTPTPSILPTTTPDPTTNWKTYTNTQYGYSLKYPQAWQALSFGPGSNGLQPISNTSRGIILSPDTGVQRVPNPMFEIQAEGSENLSRPTYADWQKQTKENFISGYKLINETSTVIGGQQAVVLEGEHVYPKNSTFVKQFIFASSNTGTFYTITFASDTKQESQPFDQILSTFKFVGQTTDILNWKTYPPSTIIGLPYSFKYPPNIEESEAQDLTYFKSGTSTLYHRWAGKINDINALMDNYQVFGAPKITFSSKSAVTFNTLTGFKATTSDGIGLYYFLGNPSLNGFLVFNFDKNDAVAENLFNEIAGTITVK